MPDRVAPHSLEAEEHIIGACLVYYKGLDEALLAVQPSDFYNPMHANIWAAMGELHRSSEHVDVTTVAERMRQNGTAVADTPKVLTLLMGDAPSTAGLRSRIDMVVSKARLRSLLHFALEVADRCYDQGSDPKAVLEWAQQEMFDTITVEREASYPMALQDALDDWLTDYEQRRAQGPDAFGVRTGLPELDKKLAGLRGGQLVTIAARPGIGKSLMCSQTALYAASTGHGVLLCSLEMSRRELVQRIVAARSQVSLTTLRDADIKTDDMEKVVTAIGGMAGAQMSILADGDQTIATIRVHGRRLKARGQLGLIVVDYLQLVKSIGRRENRQVEVAEVSSGLKRIAMDLEVPVLAAAQLNRGVEYRQEKRPTLADLRESGAIENDSDTVIGIHRPGAYSDKGPDEHQYAELVILKQRSGPTGAVDVEYLPETGEFIPWHPERW